MTESRQGSEPVVGASDCSPECAAAVELKARLLDFIICHGVAVANESDALGANQPNLIFSTDEARFEHGLKVAQLTGQSLALRALGNYMGLGIGEDSSPTAPSPLIVFPRRPAD